MKAYLIARMREPSTWRGVAFILAAAGVPGADPATVTQVGLGVAGLIGVLLPDKT